MAASPTWHAKFRTLVERSRLAEAADMLQGALPADRTDLGDELAVLRADIGRLETERRRETITFRKYQAELRRMSFRLFEIAKAVAPGQSAAPGAAPRKAPAATENSVFLSYNHADDKTAALVRVELERHGVPVRIDSKAMDPGEPIRAFIHKSVRSTAATVCIVSRRSLLSGWVAVESLLALAVEELWGRRRFIACYLDDEFLDPRFTVKAIDIIDKKIDELEKLLEKHRMRRVDTAALNEEKTRLFGLRNGLDAILTRLRGSLCLDMRPRARAASLARLVEALKKHQVDESA